jgi:hypothetical protein
MKDGKAAPIHDSSQDHPTSTTFLWAKYRRPQVISLQENIDERSESFNG